MRRAALVALAATVALALIGVEPRANAAPPADPPTAEVVPGPVPAPAMDPPPDRVVLMGDSVAVSIGSALAQSAAAHGMFLHNASRSGCSQIEGVTTTPAGVLFPWSTGCAGGTAAFQRDIIGQYEPQLVVWLSSWESVDRILRDVWVHFATFGGNPRIVSEIDAAVGRLTAGGARLVIAIPAPIPPGMPATTHDATARLAHLSTVLREYARQHPDKVYVVEMAELLCPAGPPCPATVNGAVPRPDGMHFDDPASRGWVADWLIAKALAPFTPAATQPGRVNASVG